MIHICQLGFIPALARGLASRLRRFGGWAKGVRMRTLSAGCSLLNSASCLLPFASGRKPAENLPILCVFSCLTCGNLDFGHLWSFLVISGHLAAAPMIGLSKGISQFRCDSRGFLGPPPSGGRRSRKGSGCRVSAAFRFRIGDSMSPHNAQKNIFRVDDYFLPAKLSRLVVFH